MEWSANYEALKIVKMDHKVSRRRVVGVPNDCAVDGEVLESG